MNRTHKRLVAGAAALAAAAAAFAVPTAAQAHRDRAQGSLTVVGLTADSRLVSFSAKKPGKVATLGAVSGLTGDTSLVGIDVRVQDRKLYGVGNQGGIYTFDRSARATKVSQLSVALAGTAFGVDFNPAADRLRIISDTGQNLRHNLGDDTTINDGTLTYPATPTVPAVTATGVTAAAYTNNDLNATTGTTLFDVDTNLDQVALQSPANAGQLAATGKLNEDTTAVAGLDIYSTVDRGGVTVRNEAYAVLTTGGRTGLYEIDLLTGDAALKGTFPRTRQVVDLAIPLGQKKR